jgi:hypothetical protein
MEEKFKKLKRFNLLMAFMHFFQAIAVWLLSDPDKGVVPITVNYLSFDSASQTLMPATESIGDVNLAWFVIGFFMLSAVFHFVIATFYRNTYEGNLAKGINKARWYEYAISASVMMLAISLLSGIYDLASLVMIFALDAVMNLLGLAMESHNQKEKKVNWITFNIGTLAGIIPWVAFGIYVYASREFGGGNIPNFVYWIYVSIFFFFNTFAINMYLQYKKVGKWKDYLFGEQMYVLLSLVAKSLLAWQVFGGTLRP